LYGGFSEDFPAGMAKLCAKADVIAPNITEASFMLGIPYPGNDYDEAYIEKMLKDLRSLGAANVVLTGVSYTPGRVGVATYDGNTVGYYDNEFIDGYYHGTGDVYASAFLAYYVKSRALLHSASKAADFTVACIRKKQEVGGETRYGVPFELCLESLIDASRVH